MIDRLLLLVVLVPLGLAAGCAGGEKRAGEAVPYTTDDSSDGIAWGDYVDADGTERIAFVDTPRCLALVRVEEGRLIDPSLTDLKSVSQPLSGWSVYGITRPSGGYGHRLDRTALRRIAGMDRADHLLVAQFGGRGRERRLTATLYETRTGREIARYGPGEPSLTIAAHHLTQKPHPN